MIKRKNTEKCSLNRADLKSIEEGLKDIKRGFVYSSKEVLKILKRKQRK